MRVVAAMSGGVDSSVAAARMVDEGHDVVGVHLALTRSASALRAGARGCCSLEDSADARRVADHLGIPFYVWDLAEDFHRDVVEDFIAGYAAGQTPNPCLRCNESIKFAALLDKALALGFDGVATGHYARVIDPGRTGGRELHRAVDDAKDQSYVLAVLDEEQLAAAYFPLGGSTKQEIRAEAEQRGFRVAAKPDSHDICFIPDGDTRAFLARHLDADPGPIVDPDGIVVGEHDGALGYTVGQRRGLRLGRPSPDGRPRYVLEVRPEERTVVVGPEELLGIDLIRGIHLRWTGPPLAGGACVDVQLRAHGQPVPARAEVTGGPGTDDLVVHLEQRTRGVAPGQAIVMYDGTRVVGSATIVATGRI